MAWHPSKSPKRAAAQLAIKHVCQPFVSHCFPQELCCRVLITKLAAPLTRSLRLLEHRSPIIYRYDSTEFPVPGVCYTITHPQTLMTRLLKAPTPVGSENRADAGRLLLRPRATHGSLRRGGFRSLGFRRRRRLHLSSCQGTYFALPC